MRNFSNTSMSRRTLLTAIGATWACAEDSRREETPVRRVQTVTGPVAPDDLGITLMHEHVVADLRPPSERVPGDYDRADAVATALPHLKTLREAGCRTLVDPTPIHIGRDPEALRTLAERAGLNIVCATGVYGAADQRFIPEWARSESAEALAERYLEEIKEGIGDSGVRPGIIKTGVNAATPLPDVERKLVRAAAAASKASGLATASHTGPAAGAFEQLRIIAEVGLDPARFIWVHTQNEADPEMHIEAARRGAWVEFDGVAEDSAERHLYFVRAMADAGFLDRVLISQDAGWYRPGPERGSKFRGYEYLLRAFAPKLRAAGFNAEEIDRLLIGNPARALAG